MEKEKILIGNDFVPTDETINIINPYSSEIVKQVCKTKPEQINESLEYLTNVFEKYKKRG